MVGSSFHPATPGRRRRYLPGAMTLTEHVRTGGAYWIEADEIGIDGLDDFPTEEQAEVVRGLAVTVRVGDDPSDDSDGVSVLWFYRGRCARDLAQYFVDLYGAGLALVRGRDASPEYERFLVDRLHLPHASLTGNTLEALSAALAFPRAALPTMTRIEIVYPSRDDGRSPEDRLRYLGRVVRNEIDRLEVQDQVPTGDGPLDEEKLVDDRPGPLELLLARERRGRVREATRGDGFSDLDRQILHLIYEGRSAAEALRSVGAPSRSSYDSLVRKIRRRLIS